MPRCEGENEAGSASCSDTRWALVFRRGGSVVISRLVRCLLGCCILMCVSADVQLGG